MRTFDESRFAARIRPLLNEAAVLDAAKRERLRAARERALAAHRPVTEPVAEAAVAGAGGRGFGRFSLRVLLPGLIVIVALAAVWSWQRQQRLAEVEEIDALLLSDDLPIDAYLDRGFEAWLKKQRAR